MSILENLEQIINSRAKAASNSSWTAKLLSGGRKRCAQKFGEEAIEAVIAGSTGSKNDLVNESADTIYHLLVLLKANDVSINEVLCELERRQTQSGIAEKASRSRES